MREVGVVYRTDILLLGGLYLYWLLARGSSPNTCYTHCTDSTQSCNITIQLVHMSHSLYYPITTALHKDVMLYNGIVPGTLGLIWGMGPEAPLNTLRAHRSPTAYTPPGDTFCLTRSALDI